MAYKMVMSRLVMVIAFVLIFMSAQGQYYNTYVISYSYYPTYQIDFVYTTFFSPYQFYYNAVPYIMVPYYNDYNQCIGYTYVPESKFSEEEIKKLLKSLEKYSEENIRKSILEEYKKSHPWLFPDN